MSLNGDLVSPARVIFTGFSAIEGLVLHYRDLEATRRAVASLLASGVDHVGIWNNGPDDFDLLPADLLPDAVGKISIATAGANLGFATGVNRALALVRSRLANGGAVLLLNNDAQITVDGVGRLATVLEAHPGAAIAFPVVDHSGWKRGQVYYHRLTGLITDKALPGSFAYASGCCMLIALDALPGSLFDEAFFMYGEDIELGHRMKGRMVALDACLVTHATNSGSGARSALYERRIVDAQLLLAERLASGAGSRRWLLALHMGMLLLRAAWRSVRFISTVPLQALWGGVVHMRRASS